MTDDLARHAAVTALLEAATGWHTVVHRDEVTSTNDLALEQARAGVGPGLVVVADRQTAGRGRAGRGWEDGANAAASLLATATVAAPATGAALVPLAAGLAVVDASRSVDVDVTLKWPNDVLVADRKCAGILVERHTVASGDVLLVGIGIDVDWRGAERYGPSADWTSLAEEAGRDVDRGELLAGLLESLASWLPVEADDRDRLLAAYRRHCSTLGRDVEVTAPGGAPVSGHAVDVDAEGRLLVDTNRERIAVSAGDVVHLRSS